MCKKLGIIPFEYAMSFISVFKSGSVIPQAALQIEPEQILSSFKQTVQAFAGLSLQSHLPNKISVSHEVKNTFKNLMSIGLASDYKFEQLTKALTASQNSAPALV